MLYYYFKVGGKMKTNSASDKNILKNSYKDYIKFIKTRLKTNQHLLNGFIAERQEHLIYNETGFQKYIDKIYDKDLAELLNFILICLNKNRKTLNNKQKVLAFNLQEETLSNEQINLIKQYYALKYIKYALHTKTPTKSPQLVQEL